MGRASACEHTGRRVSPSEPRDASEQSNCLLSECLHTQLQLLFLDVGRLASTYRLDSTKRNNSDTSTFSGGCLDGSVPRIRFKSDRYWRSLCRHWIFCVAKDGKHSWLGRSTERFVYWIRFAIAATNDCSTKWTGNSRRFTRLRWTFANSIQVNFPQRFVHINLTMGWLSG